MYECGFIGRALKGENRQFLGGFPFQDDNDGTTSLQKEALRQQMQLEVQLVPRLGLWLGLLMQPEQPLRPGQRS